jgi:hypothetical protein
MELVRPVVVIAIQTQLTLFILVSLMTAQAIDRFSQQPESVATARTILIQTRTIPNVLLTHVTMSSIFLK